MKLAVRRVGGRSEHRRAHESTDEPGKMQVAPATRELLAGRFELAERGIIEARQGPMQTWFLIARKPPAAYLAASSWH